MIRVSIIIATYNSGRTIRKALNSVVNQIFQEWECLIIDGLSKDNTLQIVKEFAEKDKRIKYISEKDEGIYDAFNKGWKMAQGEWIHYLGSDDWLTKESFCKFFVNDEFLTSGTAVMSGNVYRVTRKGDLQIVASHGWNGGHQAKLTRRNILLHYNGFNNKYKYLADAELMYRMKKEGCTIVNVDTIVAYYSYGGASEKISHQVEMAKERLSFYKLDNNIKNRYFLVMKKFIIGVASIIKTQICGR